MQERRGRKECPLQPEQGAPPCPPCGPQNPAWTSDSGLQGWGRVTLPLSVDLCHKSQGPLPHTHTYSRSST